MKAQEIKSELLSMYNAEKKQILQRFFKTGKGEYGEGDQFLGITVPQIRVIVKREKTLEISEIQMLLSDEYHECRMIALFFLVELYEHAKSEEAKQDLYRFYIQHVDYINNWDFVDLTAYKIVGAYLWDKDRSDLYSFAKQNHLWLQRISIVSTYYFIREKDFSTTFDVANLLINHKHDLIHKAVGWMLREVGKRDYRSEYIYLTENKRYKIMPRTMLRYAIEKFPEDIRQEFLKGKI